MKESALWNADLYDSKHDFVFKYGEDLVKQLNPQKGERILDLGCGTGYLTNVMAESGAEVIGIDNSEAMIAKFRQAYPEVNFKAANAEDFKFENKFDAIFSNAVLHWVTGYKNVINATHAVNDALRLRLSPNPATNIVNIYVNGLQQSKSATLSIISISGMVLKTMQISNSSTQLDVSSLAGGVYTIKVISGDKVVFKKLAKL